MRPRGSRVQATGSGTQKTQRTPSHTPPPNLFEHAGEKWQPCLFQQKSIRCPVKQAHASIASSIARAATARPTAGLRAAAADFGVDWTEATGAVAVVGVVRVGVEVVGALVGAATGEAWGASTVATAGAGAGAGTGVGAAAALSLSTVTWSFKPAWQSPETCTPDA